MTIDKAIEKYKKLANNDTTCYQEEAQQLAEWLEELKKLRQCTNIENREYPYFNGFKEGKQVGYNKAIDDFMDILLAERTQCYNFDDSEHNNPIKCVWWNDIEGIAEQLKAGGTDV